MTYIPLHVWQTWTTKELPPKMEECVNHLKLENPEFEFHLYDVSDCYNFIEANFPIEFTAAYNALIPGAYKADFWRLCILYIYGGIYCDIKLWSENGFRLIRLTDKEYFMNDGTFTGSDGNIHRSVANGLIAVRPNNTIILRTLVQLVINVSLCKYGISPWAVTGPQLLGSFWEEIYTSKPELTHTVIDYNGKRQRVLMFEGRVIFTFYEEYFTERSAEAHTNYQQMWHAKNIYDSTATFSVNTSNWSVVLLDAYNYATRKPSHLG